MKKNNNNRKNYKVAVIGLGNIGMGYAKKSLIKSHSHSILEHKNFSLEAGIDKSLKKINLFKKIFKKNSFQSIKQLEKFKIDVAILSTPEFLHKKKLSTILHITLMAPLPKKFT